MRNEFFLMSQCMATCFLVVLACMDAFTYIVAARWLTVNQKSQKRKDASFLAYKRKKSTSKLDIPCSWFCIMHWKPRLDFYNIMQRFITEIFLVQFVKIYGIRHIPKNVTYIYLLKCGRYASSLRKGKVLNTTIKVIFEDFCIRVPLTHWLFNYLFGFTKKCRRGNFQLSVKKKNYSD